MLAENSQCLDGEIPESERHEIYSALTSPVQKMINPKYFYDQLGSELFEKITHTAEYYPTRTEQSILHDYAAEIADTLGRGGIVLEPGAGNCEKIRYLLAALQPHCYLPMDISAAFLQQSVAQLNVDFPWLRVEPLVGDFAEDLSLPDEVRKQPIQIFYPGSTIGNFEPAAAVMFLRRMAGYCTADGGILLGVDMDKSAAVLNAAYNDKAGITAAFNLNILKHLNRLLSADFALENFRHHAFYNQSEQRVEMHLVANRAHTVHSNMGDIHFGEDESIHTECSYKYTLTGLAALAAKAGLVLRKSWLDENRLFSVNYLVPA